MSTQKAFFVSGHRGNPFIFFSKAMPFDLKDFPQAFFPVVGLMARDSNFNIKRCSSNGNILSIDCYYRGKVGQLYLRYNAGLDHRLVVASVQFIHRRNGYMTELLSILKQIRRTYRTGPIVIENVLSDEMKAWCHKNGFDVDPKASGNYIWPSTAGACAGESNEGSF